MSDSKEMVKAQTTALDFAQPGMAFGFEDVDMSTVSMPRAKIMQGLSPELADSDYNFKQGDIIHSLMMEKLPETFVPIRFWDSNIMFVPRKDTDKKAFFDALHIEPTTNMIICRSLNGKNVDTSMIGKTNCQDCVYKKFGWDGNPATPPLCTASINALAMFEGLDMPIVIQFSNTNYKYGRKFRDMAVFAGGAAFTKKYKLAAKAESNDQGRFFTTPVKPAGKVEDKATLDSYFDLYKRFSKVSIEVEAENDMAETMVPNEF